MPIHYPQTDDRRILGLFGRRRGAAPDEYEPEIDLSGFEGFDSPLPPTPTPGAGGPVPTIAPGPTPPPLYETNYTGEIFEKGVDGDPVVFDDPMGDLDAAALQGMSARDFSAPDMRELGGMVEGKSLDMADFEDDGFDDPAIDRRSVLGANYLVDGIKSLGRRFRR